MKVIVAAIHGIMTRQTDASWPDELEAWLLDHDPMVHVVKRKYFAAPLPYWNVWVKDPWLARGLANELEAIVESKARSPKSKIQSQPEAWPIWFVAHSNGAVIALMAAKRLIERGHLVSGLILTGAACGADIRRNGVMDWYRDQQIEAAIAYSSEDDAVVAGDPTAPKKWYWKLRDWVWGKAMWPYGSLGRTGWMMGNEVWTGDPGIRLFTRWFHGGHSAYFTPQNRDKTFRQVHEDICAVECAVT